MVIHSKKKKTHKKKPFDRYDSNCAFLAIQVEATIIFYFNYKYESSPTPFFTRNVGTSIYFLIGNSH